MEKCPFLPSDKAISFKACTICGRTFHPDSLQRHENICEKTTAKSRKVFDSSQQRAKNIISVPPKPARQEETKRSKSNWKAQHEELLRTVRNEKVEPNPYERGRPQQKVIPMGYFQCPVCRRCFNHKAADRHISWCREQLSRLPKSPPSSEAMMRLKARIQYRAPLPSRKRYSLEDGQRLIKSAETCKSASMLRTHSSPCTSNERSNQKQVGFLLPSGVMVRRKSCERSTFKEPEEEEEVVYRTYNTLPSKSSFRRCSPQETIMKFKEKFPEYSAISRKSYRQYQKNEVEMLFCNNDDDEDDDDEYNNENIVSTITRNKNYDILSALQLQIAELQLGDRMRGPSARRTKTNINLPDVSSHQEPSPSRTNKSCDLLVVQGSSYASQKSEKSGALSTKNLENSASAFRLPRFCYQCGTKYPVDCAKYCCECGAKRLVINNNCAT